MTGESCNNTRTVGDNNSVTSHRGLGWSAPAVRSKVAVGTTRYSRSYKKRKQYMLVKKRYHIELIQYIRSIRTNITHMNER